MTAGQVGGGLAKNRLGVVAAILCGSERRGPLAGVSDRFADSRKSVQSQKARVVRRKAGKPVFGKTRNPGKAWLLRPQSRGANRADSDFLIDSGCL